LPHLRSAAGTVAWYGLRLLILGAAGRIDSMAAEAGKPARLLALAPADLRRNVGRGRLRVFECSLLVTMFSSGN
jgi:hypothetical protein